MSIYKTYSFKSDVFTTGEDRKENSLEIRSVWKHWTSFLRVGLFTDVQLQHSPVLTTLS